MAPFLLVTTLLLLMLSVATQNVQALTCYVSPTGNPTLTDCTNSADPCKDFKFAIESGNCTTIFPSPGLYTGINNTGITATLPLAIIANSGGVVLQGDGSDRFFSIVQNAVDVSNFTFVLSGDIEVRNYMSLDVDGGGAILIIISGSGASAAETAIINGVTFFNNSASRPGTGTGTAGAMSITGLPTTLQSCTFRQNSVFCPGPFGSCFAGALRLDRLATFNPMFQLFDCLFEGNSVLSLQRGMGAVIQGGGLSVGGPSPQLQGSDLIIRRSRFIDNSLTALGIMNSQVRGGGISMFGANASFSCQPGEKELCVVAGNRVFSAATGPPRNLLIGAGISAITPSGIMANLTFLELNNVVIYNNSISCNTTEDCAVQYGGGGVASSRVLINGCRFCNNSAVNGTGADIFIVSSTDVELLDTGNRPNVFTCNNTGPSIEPLSFSCGPPDCLFPQPIVDPATGICEACVLFLTPTPTGM